MQTEDFSMCTYKIYKNPSGGRTSKASFSRRNIIHKYLMRATMHSPIFVLHPGISVLPDNMLVQDNTLFLPALDTSALAILFLESSCQQAALSYHHPMRSFQNRTLFSSSPKSKYLPNIPALHQLSAYYLSDNSLGNHEAVLLSTAPFPSFSY